MDDPDRIRRAWSAAVSRDLATAALILFSASLLGCRSAPSPDPGGSVPAAGDRPAVVREILDAAGDGRASTRLRTRIELLDRASAVVACAQFLATPAADAGERAAVADFLAGIGHPSWIDALVETMAAPDAPVPLVLAANRALCAASFYTVELDPALHFEERRAIVAADWARWWRANCRRTQTEWLATRIRNAHEAERLDIIRHVIRVADASAVPVLIQYVDSGTLEFRGLCLLAISYLTNTIFLEPGAGESVPDPRFADSELPPAPSEIKLLDAILVCLDWWKLAIDHPPEQWVREGFTKRGYLVHDPPQPEDLDALIRALEDPHPAVRSQALRHLVVWTGQVLVEDPAGGSQAAFRRMADEWRAWRAERVLAWDRDAERFVESPPPPATPRSAPPRRS